MFVIGPTQKNGFAVRAGGPLAVACSDASRCFCISFVVANVFSKLFVVLNEIVYGFMELHSVHYFLVRINIEIYLSKIKHFYGRLRFLCDLHNLELLQINWE